MPKHPPERKCETAYNHNLEDPSIAQYSLTVVSLHLSLHSPDIKSLRPCINILEPGDIPFRVVFSTVNLLGEKDGHRTRNKDTVASVCRPLPICHFVCMHLLKGSALGKPHENVHAHEMRVQEMDEQRMKPSSSYKMQSSWFLQLPLMCSLLPSPYFPLISP